MSENITAAATDNGAAVTEGVEQPHAAASSQMIVGEHDQGCAQCASLEQELAVASEAHEELTQAMTDMRNDNAVSTELANQRELQMFQSKAETESALLQLQGEYEILILKIESSDIELRNARSTIDQIKEEGFCFQPSHEAMQEDLDLAHCEITELRSTETALEKKIVLLKERVADMQKDTASTIGRKVEQGRKKSSGQHPSMSALLEE